MAGRHQRRTRQPTVGRLKAQSDGAFNRSGYASISKPVPAFSLEPANEMPDRSPTETRGASAQRPSPNSWADASRGCRSEHRRSRWPEGRAAGAVRNPALACRSRDEELDSGLPLRGIRNDSVVVARHSRAGGNPALALCSGNEKLDSEPPLRGIRNDSVVVARHSRAGGNPALALCSGNEEPDSGPPLCGVRNDDRLGA